MTFRILHWTCRALLAAIFLYTGYIKVEYPLQFAAVLFGYKLFPDSLILPLSHYFPWVEIALGILLLVGWKIRYVSMGACGLLTTFVVILAVTYLRGIDANCGCFSFDDRITPLTVVRDALIILPALYLVVEDSMRSGTSSGGGGRCSEPEIMILQTFGLVLWSIQRFEITSQRFYEENKRLSIRRSRFSTRLSVVGTSGCSSAYVIILLRAVNGVIRLGSLTFLAGSFARGRDLIERWLLGTSGTYQQCLHLKGLFDLFEMKPSIVNSLQFERRGTGGVAT